MAVSSSTVLRVRGLPSNQDIGEIISLLERSLQIGWDASGSKITSLAEDPYDPKKQVATLMFLADIPALFTTSTTNEWSRYVAGASCSSGSDGDLALTFDTHFRGLTALNTPSKTEDVIDCVAVCGLGGHAFGSFKEKGTSHMWLRDSLAKDIPNMRVLLYGYESGLEGSDSNQNVSVIAGSFVGHLSELRPRSKNKVISRPLIIIAHSLGGLVVKQALINLAHGNEYDKKQMESVVGLLFFGVPNRGMDIESLQAIVRDKQNRYLLESVGQHSDLLIQQDGQFGSTFHFKDTQVVSFFETRSSPTALKVNDTWKMEGPSKVLAPRFSATRPRLWDLDPCEEGLYRTHSELVKFSVNDVDYERVRHRLQEIASKASATITSRYLNQESPDRFDADEEACLRSLSFTEIYAREGIVEEALQDTGSWLLKSQNFQDWRQRRKLQEHRGFFWIQGNPGSGKSTLIKKIYSHVRACEKDASSVVAAFFFNARGTEIEKSPTGLLRTLLHTLCQRISALRSIVVKAYTAKYRLVRSGWQWQLSELKEFLAFSVQSSVLGKRSLILFIDALDECDSNATKSVIQFFENLAKSSLSEGTDFNICLSSRYWPQIRIQHFVARVELQNGGDIARYIREHLDSTQMVEIPDVLSLLKTEILDKAKGTFLWVVLVIRELLNANGAGATLRELRSIVQGVPPDLGDFYQHQLQSTKGKDCDHMLRLLQLVFYAFRPLSPTELRHALAFGCEAYPSYADWSRSNEYVKSDEQMDKRIREHSKGLVEIAQLPGEGADDQKLEDDQDSDDDHDSDDDRFKAHSRGVVVQFVHQSVRDFLEADGFSFLRDNRQRTHNADGHEFFKTASCNYLKIKDFEAISTVNLRIGNQFDDRQSMELKNNHPLLEYMVEYIFPHAAQAEIHGICQDRFRTCIYSHRGYFKRWRCLHDAIIDNPDTHAQGPNARPIHVLAQYGLLTREIAEKESNVDMVGGTYDSALVAACWCGHEDAVGILLDLGADPKFHISKYIPGYLDEWPTFSMAPLSGAIHRQDLPMLRRILNHQSVFTLRDRLQVSRSVRGNEEHPDKLGAVLALLIPEATLPDSVVDGLYTVASVCDPKVLSFLLDKFDKKVVHDVILWHKVLSSYASYRNYLNITSYANSRISKVKALLDRGGRIQITAAVMERLLELEGSSPVRVLQLLLEHCHAEITEDLIDSITLFSDSSQIVRTLQARGYLFKPFTSKQLLHALRSGSAESAAFFLESHDGNTSAEDMLCSALSNDSHGEEVSRLLLGLLNPDSINERAIITALENSSPSGDNLIRLLHSRWSSLPFSEATLDVAVRNRSPDIVKLILEGLESVEITEEILTATSKGEWYPQKSFELLFCRDPDICIQESTIIGAIESKEIEILRVFCRHEKPLRCTEDIILTAANSVIGPDALKIILQQDREAIMSCSMIMTAMQAERGAALVSVMLDHDETIDIKEEHLVAAASNLYDPTLIFTLLQTRGKLDNADPATDIAMPIVRKGAGSTTSRPSGSQQRSSTQHPPMYMRQQDASF